MDYMTTSDYGWVPAGSRLTGCRLVRGGEFVSGMFCSRAGSYRVHVPRSQCESPARHDEEQRRLLDIVGQIAERANTHRNGL